MAGRPEFPRRRVECRICGRRRCRPRRHVHRACGVQDAHGALALRRVLRGAGAHGARVGVVSPRAGQRTPVLGPIADDPGFHVAAVRAARRSRERAGRGARSPAADARRRGDGGLLARDRARGRRQSRSLRCVAAACGCIARTHGGRQVTLLARRRDCGRDRRIPRGEAWRALRSGDPRRHSRRERAHAEARDRGAWRIHRRLGWSPAGNLGLAPEANARRGTTRRPGRYAALRRSNTGSENIDENRTVSTSRSSGMR